MEAFEKLVVWRRSARLCVELYNQLKGCPDRGFRDQLSRAALSVPSSIAEGYERDSKKEFARFLRIAKGSSGEVRTQIYIGIELGYFTKEAGRRFLGESRQIAKMLRGLIKSCESLAT